MTFKISYKIFPIIATTIFIYLIISVDNIKFVSHIDKYSTFCNSGIMPGACRKLALRQKQMGNIDNFTKALNKGCDKGDSLACVYLARHFSSLNSSKSYAYYKHACRLDSVSACEKNYELVRVASINIKRIQ